MSLASPDEAVFWHELARTAHKHSPPTDYKMRRWDKREVIADTVAVPIGCPFSIKLTQLGDLTTACSITPTIPQPRGSSCCP
ncbi:MAG: hypothetical protein JW759_09550 [Candidatus Coatesbacteria bacterium]|nr:hypothetical protein [Candidatus Coatesbacteria bacterium]